MDASPSPSAAPASGAPSRLAVGTPEHYRWLHGIVKTILVLNLLDALFTLVWVRWGLATEANTLIDELVNENALGFIFVKLALVGMGSWFLWQQRERPYAVIAIFVSFIAYYLVLLYHVQYLSRLVQTFLAWL